MTVLARSRHQKCSLCPKIIKRNFLPVLRNRWKNMNYPRVALHQHLLDTSRKSKVPLQGERPIGKVGIAGLALIAIDVKGIGQTKALCKDPQDPGCIFTIKSPGI